MIAEIDIYSSAKVIMDQYGDRALLEAMNRLEKYRHIGNNHGMNVWRRIADAIETLQIPAHLSTQTTH
jgi:hypothetical protein